MPKLLRDTASAGPRTENYICLYKRADGKWCKKSTKQKDQTAAWEVCLALQRAEDLAAAGSLSGARAQQLIDQVIERTTGAKVQRFTVATWFDHWLGETAVAGAESTLTKYRATCASFLAHIGDKASRGLDAVVREDVTSFRGKQQASGKHPNTIRYIIKQLRIPFNAALKLGLITSNPASIELPNAPKNEDGEVAGRKGFTVDEIKAILAATEDKRRPFKAADDWRLAVLFAAYTGARLKDITELTWGRIDMKARTVAIRAQKTGKLATVPLHDSLKAALAKRKAGEKRQPVFPGLYGRKTSGNSGLSQVFGRIMERAGIERTVLREATGAGRTIKDLSFHSLRHSFTSGLANADVAPELRKKLTGHDDDASHEKYTHLEMETLRAAVAKLPAITIGAEPARSSRIRPIVAETTPAQARAIAALSSDVWILKNHWERAKQSVKEQIQKWANDPASLPKGRFHGDQFAEAFIQQWRRTKKADKVAFRALIAEKLPVIGGAT